MTIPTIFEICRHVRMFSGERLPRPTLRRIGPKSLSVRETRNTSIQGSSSRTPIPQEASRTYSPMCAGGWPERAVKSRLAPSLGKSPRSISSYLNELHRQRVCQLQAAANQHQNGFDRDCRSLLALSQAAL